MSCCPCYLRSAWAGIETESNDILRTIVCLLFVRDLLSMTIASILLYTAVALGSKLMIAGAT